LWFTFFFSYILNIPQNTTKVNNYFNYFAFSFSCPARRRAVLSPPYNFQNGQPSGYCKLPLLHAVLASPAAPAAAIPAQIVPVALILSPIHRTTGTAIELPKALYRGPSADAWPRYGTWV
jgi:hypothetical protein